MVDAELSLPRRPLPPEVEQARENTRRMRAALLRKGEEGYVLPTVGRRRLLQSPIWFDPRIARQHSQSTFAWTQESDGSRTMQAISTTNVQPGREVEDGAERSYNPGGLLTWMDLDLMMFLSAVYAARNVPYIDTDQRAVFSAIGYAALDDPPYHELRSAIKRLLGTQVWLFWENAADGSVDYRALPPLLVQQDQNTSPWQREGKRSKLVVAIGGGWISDVVSENQVIDLNPYLYLVRQIRSADAANRRISHGRGGRIRDAAKAAAAAASDGDAIRPPDIARSIYLFCDSLRRLEGDAHKTVLKTSWLLERFGDRHTPIPEAFADLDLKARADRMRKKRAEPALDGAQEANRVFGELPRPDYKYANVMHPNGRIARAIDALQRLGIFTGVEVTGDRMEVRWCDPASLPRLSIGSSSIAWTDQKPTTLGWRPVEQQRLLAVDRATGAIHSVGIQVHEAPPAEEAAPRRADVAFLLRLVPVGRSRLKTARAAGWGDLQLKHLLIIALWRRSGGTVRDAAAFAAHELAEKEASAYERAAIESSLDYQAVQRWWAGPDSPLATHAGLRRHAAAPAPAPAAPAPDELIDQVAAELASNSAAAARLGHPAASLRQRVRSAERIAADDAALTAWRAAIHR